MAAWILIVDGYESDANLIQRLISKGGLSTAIERRSTALEALAILNSNERAPALVLLDSHLPGMTALELLARIRQSEKTSFVPVVVMSADTRSSSVKAALSAGANSFMCKTFEYERMRSDLEGAISYWLGIHCAPEQDGALLGSG